MFPCFLPAGVAQLSEVLRSEAAGIRNKSFGAYQEGGLKKGHGVMLKIAPILFRTYCFWCAMHLLLILWTCSRLTKLTKGFVVNRRREIRDSISFA
jgi:hypothetical protein